VRTGCRQPIPSSNIDSCACVSDTVPLLACGQMNRPRSSRFAKRQSPSPSHHNSLIRSPRFPRNTKSFQAACVKVGLGVKIGPKPWQYKGLLIHDLRRSGVRNLSWSGVHRTIAMKVSGHKTEAVFERYDIVDSTDLHDAMAKVEDRFEVSLKGAEAEARQENQ
jgi:hypothetical protein